MNNSKIKILVAIIGAMGAIIAALIMALMSKNDTNIVVIPQQSAQETPASTPQNIPREMATNIAAPAPQAECVGGGMLTDLSIPAAPAKGCVLVVEWWYPPNPTPCGLWFTTGEIKFDDGIEGSWWYIYPTRISSHTREFTEKSTNAPCEVKDFTQQ